MSSAAEGDPSAVPFSSREKSNERYRLWRAPIKDEARLLDPAYQTLPSLAQSNRANIPSLDLQGKPLNSLIHLAREEVLNAARQYTSGYRDLPDMVVTPENGPLFFLAGHQPELFHPGVWFKNFVLDRLARSASGIAINLVIDCDTLKSPSLKVPGGTLDNPVLASVGLDRSSGAVPFEHREVLDNDLFTSFGRRAKEVLKPLISEPLLESFWPMVIARKKQTPLLGACLSQARHQWEGTWGLKTLELPQSHVCRLTAFHWFLASLLAQLPRFWKIHNQAVLDYRQTHHVRSAHHPVPLLDQQEDWWEAPFWIWSRDNLRRRPLFVRCLPQETHLTDRQGWNLRLDLGAETTAAKGAERLSQLEDNGIFLRTRALTTTWFARVFLGDLFLHGIGGGKYDRLTDELIRRFWGVKPPEYAVGSATMLLPLSRPNTSSEDLRKIDRRLQDLQFHPETFFPTPSVEGYPKDSFSPPLPSADSTADYWIQHKHHWIKVEPTPQNARTRCREIRRANEMLRPTLNEQREDLRHQREEILHNLHVNSILGSRDYGFCFFPEKKLKNFLLEISP